MQSKWADWTSTALNSPEDRNWVWAGVRLVGRNRVEVWSAGVEHPVAVRYGGADNPVVNHCNSARLPVTPFRTDDWLRVTFRAIAKARMHLSRRAVIGILLAIVAVIQPHCSAAAARAAEYLCAAKDTLTIAEMDAGDTLRFTLENGRVVEFTLPYAYAGGVRAGYTSHTHFVFKTQQPGQEQWLMDPWVLFWEIFNNNRRKEGEGAAHMRTLGPAQTGQPVAFDASGSRQGVWESSLEYLWDFGDGSLSTRIDPEHKFVEPGIYPVTLTVTDDADSHSIRQHLTVDGPSLVDGSITLDNPGIPSFTPRKNWKTSAAGEVGTSPSTVTFRGFDDETDEYAPLEVFVNAGAQLLRENNPASYKITIHYQHSKD